jgi:predicted transcriptional regulator
MSRTVSFVARDELADWLEQRAESRMKSISAVCQDIVAAEYRRQQEEQASIGDQTQDDGDSTPEPLQSDTKFPFATKREADAVRTQFTEYLSDSDDRRMTDVVIAEGTPGEALAEIRRRAE